MAVLVENPLTSPADLEIRAAQVEVVTWQEREALRLEDGLALIPGYQATDASGEVLIGADGPAYPGVAVRVADALNCESVYAVPRVSGQWDAIQYDPVFHGSNTWQLYHGPSCQHAAQVPTRTMVPAAGGFLRWSGCFLGGRAAAAGE